MAEKEKKGEKKKPLDRMTAKELREVALDIPGDNRCARDEQGRTPNCYQEGKRDC